MGATIGVIAALLFGTEEGRKVVKEVLDAIPDKYKKVPENLFPLKENKPSTPLTPLIEPLETPHHTTYDFETPPPPPPMVHPTRPDNTL